MTKIAELPLFLGGWKPKDHFIFNTGLCCDNSENFAGLQQVRVSVSVSSLTEACWWQVHAPAPVTAVGPVAIKHDSPH